MAPRSKPADWTALGRQLIAAGAATDDPKATGEALRQLLESGAVVIVGLNDIGRLIGRSKQRSQQVMDPRTTSAPQGVRLERGRVWFLASVAPYLSAALARQKPPRQLDADVLRALLER